jgi:hypothetical protein
MINQTPSSKQLLFRFSYLARDPWCMNLGNGADWGHQFAAAFQFGYGAAAIPAPREASLSTIAMTPVIPPAH